VDPKAGSDADEDPPDWEDDSRPPPHRKIGQSGQERSERKKGVCLSLPSLPRPMPEAVVAC
jgi:hypothetical protein